ncbi:hypothetical protein COF61_27825 [Bacillus toyonensis]|nr:hypothetical protein COF61_27825 [Bacillus toyonensis]
MKTIKRKLLFSIDIIGFIACLIMLIITFVDFRTWLHPILFFMFGLSFFISIVNTLKRKRKNSN